VGKKRNEGAVRPSTTLRTQSDDDVRTTCASCFSKDGIFLTHSLPPNSVSRAAEAGEKLKGGAKGRKAAAVRIL
jgi:hypothetical protein